MDKGGLKNIVVLKNLPSNIVEEAIVILKTNKKARKIQKIENNKKINETEEKPKQSDYILKEAEMLISNYISKLEDDERQRSIKTIKNSKKYMRLKKYAYISSFILLIESILFIIK